MYKALIRFRDLQDGHLYEAGESFPHDDRYIPEERIKALETADNAAKMPLIVQETTRDQADKKPRRARGARKP